MVLLYILYRLEVNLEVVHINYQKRGAASDKDQELVEQMAFEWGYDCHSFRVDPGEARDNNFQQWARQKRYGIFYDLLEEFEADAIITAHHQDDQVETVLQKLFRGAGVASWRGMQVWESPLFRPLLTTSRQEIEDFTQQKAVPYRTDQSNLESDFARNLLRNEWLEKLPEFFPGWRQNVLRLPEQAAVFSDAITFIEQQLTDERDRIDARAFGQLKPRLQKSVILHVLKQRDPDITISAGALDQLENLPELQTGHSIQLTDRFSLLRDRQWLKLVYEEADSFAGIELQQEDIQSQGFFFNGLMFQLDAFQNPDYATSLYLDAKAIRWPLTLRQWQAGDAFQPFGMEGHQNVSDHLTNRKISAARKQHAMVLESFEETICAVIFPTLEKLTPPGTISERAKCTEYTSECLVITWKS